MQICKSVRFILNVTSLDYIFSSVHVKNLPPTAAQEDAWPRCRSEHLPLNIHKTVMTTRAVSPFRVAQNAALTPLLGGNCYIHQMSHHNMGHNGHRINMYGVIMTLMGNLHILGGHSDRGTLSPSTPASKIISKLLHYKL